MRTSKTIVVALLIIFMGLHWAILQSLAWITMVAAYSQETTLSTALSKTLDGQHPCRLCLWIKDARNDEKRADKKAVPPQTLTDWILQVPAAVYVPPEASQHTYVGSGGEEGLPAATPPKPPPRRGRVA